MNKIVLCLDIDDAILPAEHTYFGKFEDSLEILALNMKRIAAMLEKYDMHVFITSAWYSVLEIKDDYTLGYKREHRVRENDNYLMNEFIAYKMISGGVGKRLIGLSCGDRYKDVHGLLHAGYKVIALDDMNLSPEKILEHGGEVDEHVLESNYLFLDTHGFITNEHSYIVNKFLTGKP